MKRIICASLLVLVAVGWCADVLAFDDDRDAPKNGIEQPAVRSANFSYFRRQDEPNNQIEKKAANQNGDDAQRSLSERPQGSSSSNEPWSRTPIQETRLDIREMNPVAPRDRSLELNYGSGDWNQFFAGQKVFAWAAPDIRYRPLYFEDVPLERYGQTTGVNTQPIRSAAHFFWSVVLLPNHIRHDHPDSCDYPLGFCRPGTNVPCTRQFHYYGRPNR